MHARTDEWYGSNGRRGEDGEGVDVSESWGLGLALGLTRLVAFFYLPPQLVVLVVGTDT